MAKKKAVVNNMVVEPQGQTLVEWEKWINRLRKQFGRHATARFEVSDHHGFITGISFAVKTKAKI